VLFFAYVGDFSLRVSSFGHNPTSALKSDVTAHPFSYNDAVTSIVSHRFRRLLWRQCLCMRNK